MAEDMSAMAARLAGVKAAEVEADLPENQQLLRERKEGLANATAAARAFTSNASSEKGGGRNSRNSRNSAFGGGFSFAALLGNHDIKHINPISWLRSLSASFMGGRGSDDTGRQSSRRSFSRRPKSKRSSNRDAAVIVA